MQEKLILDYRSEAINEDLETVRDILVSTGFFYDIEIPVAVELVQERLDHGDASEYYFLFAELGGKTIAYSCFGPIAGSEGTFDLYWIVTHNDYRGKGIGRLLLEKTHDTVRDMGGRMLIAETSSLEKYNPTRHFYESMNYSKEAQIDDFYKPGDGKVFYIKRLV
jgi:GNAT superfamily N-acetyltransferase